MQDDDFFSGVTQPLTEEQKKTILENVFSQLEETVGDKMADLVNDEKFAEFENVIAEDDEEKLDAWIEQNYPGYDQLVDSTLEQLRQEVAANPQSFLSN